MKHKIDIHNFNRRLECIEAGITAAKIPRQDRKAIFRFRDKMFAESLGLPRIVKYLQSLKALSSRSSCAICEANEDQIISLLAKIERSDWGEWTKHDYKLALRKYLQFCGEDELADLITLPKVQAYKLPEELITPEDVMDLLDCQGRLEDHTFLFVLWESGCRIGEVLSLTRKRISFDAIGAVLIVEGKTGMRAVRIIESASILDEWISNCSPAPEDRVFPRTYRAYNKRIKILAARAGIEKRIYPHLFRHSRATFLAAFLTEAQLCTFFGWAMGSPMPRIYVHLAGRDLDPALMKVPSVLTSAARAPGAQAAQEVIS